MSLPHFEVASGAIDTVNTVFSVSEPYMPGTLAVFLNGQLKREDYSDGWAETSPATGVFTLDQAPLLGDVVQAFFLDTGANSGTEREVTPIFGTVVGVGDLKSDFDAVFEASGVVQLQSGLLAALADSQAVSAAVEDVERLSGILSEAC